MKVHPGMLLKTQGWMTQCHLAVSWRLVPASPEGGECGALPRRGQSQV
jgi:hypothetical protein